MQGFSFAEDYNMNLEVGLSLEGSRGLISPEHRHTDDEMEDRICKDCNGYRITELNIRNSPA